MGPDEAVSAISGFADVSRETSDRLKEFAVLLQKWNKKINLVSPSTIDDLWERHIFDSAQLLPLISEDAARLTDIGTGGGFPGLILALLTAEKQPGLTVTMIESDVRKCAFLQTASSQLGLKTRVISRRIEFAPPQNADIVTSRALAPLGALLGYAEMHLSPAGTAILMKGANADAEINEALASWAFDLQKIASKTHPDAVILKITNLRRG